MMYRILRLLITAAAALFLLAGSASSSSAAPGALDPTFGVGGLSNLAIPTNYNYATFDAAVQPDGKIVTAGYEQFMSGQTSLAVQRFNENGALDTAFGGGDGVATVSIPGTGSTGKAVKVLSNGKILVGGERSYGSSPTYFEFVLVQLNDDGTLDQNFDGDISNQCGGAAGNGIVCTRVSAVAGTDRGNALAVQANGMSVLAGSAYSGAAATFGAVRYTTTGALDPLFDGDGRVLVPVGSSSNAASQVLIQGSKILLAGTARALANNYLGNPTNTDDLGFARLNEDGSLDTTYDGDASNLISPSNGNGLVIVTPRAVATYGGVYDAALQSDGKLLATGYANDKSPAPASSSSVSVRLTDTGGLDTSFGTGGRVFIDITPGGNSAGQAIASDSAGRTIISGYHPEGGVSKTDVTRLLPNGSLDPSFAGVGYRSVDYGAGVASAPQAQVVLPDGKLLVAGGADNLRVALARLLTADDPAPPIPAPFATITSPKGKSLKASKLKSLAGTAGPAGSVKKVEVALQRKDSKLLKKQKRCAWIATKKAKFKNTKATKGKCSKPYFRNATGTNSWKFRITGRMPKGSYSLQVRVTLLDGRSGITTKSFKLK